MSTPAQIAANQANAQLSTGPRTDEGKAASSRNNLRLGFRSQTVLLPGEEPAEYESLLAELTDHFHAEDLTEIRLVREMADAEWRLRRVREALEQALTRRISELALDHPGATAIELQSRAIETLGPATGCSYGTWLRYERKFESQYERAYKDWSRYQDRQRLIAFKEAKMMERAALSPELASTVQTLTAARPAITKLASTVQNARRADPARPQIARNASCPCGSGSKYKRCCGKSAPPVLGKAA